MPKAALRIASRKSPLALWQAAHVKEKLLTKFPDLQIEIIPVTTEGDKIIDISLAKLGGKGLFVKELETLLLSKEADLAVHSMKDVPALLPEDLKIAAILKRDNPLDAFLSTDAHTLKSLPQASVIGTSSLRRQAQILRYRPDLVIKTLRGNVDTRTLKLERGEFDAIILAVAGLERLGLTHKISEILPETLMLPGVGQGALGLECRIEDNATQGLIQSLNDPLSSMCVFAERAMNAHLGGNCQSPIAGLATLQADMLFLRGMVADPEGKLIITASGRRLPMDAELLGIDVAKQLLVQGAEKLLKGAKPFNV